MDKLEENLKKAGVTNRELYARKMLLDGYIINLNEVSCRLREIGRLVRISANNINQVAKRANETGSPHENDVKQLIAEFDKLFPLLTQSKSALLSLTN